MNPRLVVARRLIRALLDGDESVATAQLARDWLDQPDDAPARCSAFDARVEPDPKHRQVYTIEAMRCPACDARLKWYCGTNDVPGRAGGGYAHCQDGRHVSRRLPGVGEPCGWPGARVIRMHDSDVVPDATDVRWRT